MWSCVRSSERGWWKSPGVFSPFSSCTRNEPAMPRCMSTSAPEERSASRYVARRPRPVTSRPSSRLTKSLGSGRRRSGRRASTRTKRAPSITGCSPRRTVSTSGSSGIGLNHVGETAFVAPHAAARYGPADRQSMNDPRRDTHFGYRTVDLDAKQGMVDDVFRSVARRYDLMNDLMSGGLHRAWKDALVTAVNPPRGEQPFRLIDVAGGTGDIAFRVVAAGRWEAPPPRHCARPNPSSAAAPRPPPARRRHPPAAADRADLP